jgi:RNA polymerase sigma factor (sigma-70 family)
MATRLKPALRGDEALLFERLNPRTLRTLRRQIASSDALIDDAVSYAWMQLLRCQPDRESVYGWLCKVAIHEAYRLSQRERRDIRVDGFIADADDETLDPAAALTFEETSEQRATAREALTVVAGLPVRQRRFLALKAGGHSYDEICELTGASYTNVNKHLTRAREQRPRAPALPGRIVDRANAPARHRHKHHPAHDRPTTRVCSTPAIEHASLLTSRAARHGRPASRPAPPSPASPALRVGYADRCRDGARRRALAALGFRAGAVRLAAVMPTTHTTRAPGTSLSPCSKARRRWMPSSTTTSPRR